jgi:hypothetical protein
MHFPLVLLLLLRHVILQQGKHVEAAAAVAVAKDD